MKKILLVLLSGFIIMSLMFIIIYENNRKTSYKINSQTSAVINQEKIFTSIQENDLESVKILIQNGIKINYRDNGGETALEHAVKIDNKDIVKYLISKGADLNTMDDHKSTPLSVIRSEGMMNLLLSKGANANTMVYAGDGEIDETAIEVAKYIVAILPN
ncbi:ankyrin repeat domain-containing protein [Clostridium frigoris]|uniref:Ankyrin repeat domain-containing protein n=1 Tax=Clostridium frigoris TaxID=205327 RepID=A0ABS6BS00_9CLOT|nr:ankyrin repeat domain-containing protein [Clostridium frigoris]MBU3159707.1 ankyrin repeat domain-containing protein [Clostridium frigoris]